MNPTPKTETPGPQSAEAADAREPEAVGTGAEAVTEPADKDAHDDLAGDDLDDGDDDELTAEPAPRVPSGLGTAVAAIVAAALGIVALTGTWTGRVVAERETLVGQLHTSQSATPAQQISELYGDAWHSTALINGIVALIAVIIAVVVLVLPQRGSWVRPVAVAAIVLGAIGVLVSLGMYFDLFASLPSAPATPAATPSAPAG